MFALGVGLVVVALLLLLAEAHLSTGGLIAVGALGSLLSGLALLLVGAQVGLVAVLAVSAGVCVAGVGGLLLLGRSLRSVRRLGPRSGTEAMIGHVGVLRVGERAARVFVDGGLWRAQPSPLEDPSALHDGDQVVVERVSGLTLSVRKAEEWESNP